MDDGLKLKGNMCACGDIWFSIDMPESDPDHCPFCGRNVSIKEALDLTDQPVGENLTEQITEHMEGLAKKDPTYEPPNNIGDALKRAKSMDGEDLCIKRCGYCTNETFFDKHDEDKVAYCPYCRCEDMKSISRFAPQRDLFAELTKDMPKDDDSFFAQLDELPPDDDDDNELQTVEDINVLLNKIEETIGRNTMSGMIGKRVSIFMKGIESPKVGHCSGMDTQANFIRIDVLGGKPEWLSLGEVESISDLSDDD